MEKNDYKTIIKYAGDELFIGIPPTGHAQILDTKSDRKSAPTPLEYLLIAVGGCTATDVVSVLEKKRQKISDYKIEVTADRRDEFPRYFTKINVHHIVYGQNISEQAVAQAIELSDEKYCSVAGALRPTAEITTSFEIVETKD